MDMDIDVSIRQNFKVVGVTDETDLLQLDKISKETGVGAEVLSKEWDLYAVEKGLSDPASYKDHFVKFKTQIKKNALKLKKAAAAVAPSATVKSTSNKSTPNTAPAASAFSAKSSTNQSAPIAVTVPTNGQDQQQLQQDEDFQFDLEDDDNNNNNDNDVQDFEFDFANVRAILPLRKGQPVFNYAARKESNKVVSTVNKSLVVDMRSMGQAVDVKVTEMLDTQSMSYLSDNIASRIKQLTEDAVKSMSFDQASTSEQMVRVAGRVWPEDSGALYKRFRLLGHTQPGVNTFTLKSDTPIFSGQIVQVEGKMVGGSNFGCDSIYYPKQLEIFSGSQKDDQSTHIMFASGPFSLHQCFDYSPLDDFLSIVEKNKCNLVILFGPFIDQNHNMIQFLDDENLFDTLISKLSGLSSTQFIVVPSIQDVTGEYVYPQPPLPSKRKYNNIKFVSNPSTLVINDAFTIGLNNTKIIQDIQSSQQNLSKLSIGEICKMIVEQQSYYPLHPAEMPLEMAYLDKLKFPGFTPNIMLFGSESHFVEDVNEVLCISSGSLVHPASQGCYTDIFVTKQNDNAVSIPKKTKIITTKI